MSHTLSSDFKLLLLHLLFLTYLRNCRFSLNEFRVLIDDFFLFSNMHVRDEELNKYDDIAGE